MTESGTTQLSEAKVREIVDEFEWYQESKKQLEAHIAALEAELARKDAALKTAYALLDSKSRNADRIEEALRLAMQAKPEAMP